MIWIEMFLVLLATGKLSCVAPQNLTSVCGLRDHRAMLNQEGV
jgi:hypothetical protein